MKAKSENDRRWALEMRRSRMFQPGERVGVAVSGGPDSVLLLEFLSQVAPQFGLVLSVVHFNHHLRGEESEEDEQFVRRLAQQRGLPIWVGGARVDEIARRRHRNLEATARELRYRYFFSLISQGRLDKVATAHTANDQAETVLLRLLRGAGTRGLAGIYPSLGGEIVRPFLNLTRRQIEQEIAARQLPTRTDSSNLDLRLTRNRIRRELLPLIERDYSPDIIRLLAELAARARDDEAFLEEQARERAQAWRVREGPSEKISLQALAGFPPAIARRALRQALQSVRGSLLGLTYRHIEEIRRLAAEAQSGRKIHLPQGIEARKEFGWLILSPISAEKPPEEFHYAVNVPGSVSVPELGRTFEFKIVQAASAETRYNTKGDWALDPDKVGRQVQVRNWRAGDRYQPVGRRGPEKLKELFRQARIPAGERPRWPVVEGPDGILWVKGLLPSQAAAIRPHEREHLVILEKPLQPSDTELSG